MAGLLSAAMLAEVRRPDAQLANMFELQLASGTRRAADRTIASATLGPMPGKVLRWSQARRAVSDRDGGMQLNDLDLDYLDVDGSFRKLLASAERHSLRGTRAVCKLISPRVVPSDWFTFYDGVLKKKDLAGPQVWKLVLHPNDQPLRGVFPKLRVLQADFPNAGDKTIYGGYPPVIYGEHDSRASTDGGMVPCSYVDRIGFRYLVALGWVTVNRVYKDGIGVSSGYSVTHPTINGRLYTLIDFVADQGVDAVITADVTGYESVGDGSGSTLTGANALKHLLVNFVYGDWQAGAWLLDATAPVHTSSFSSVQSILNTLNWQKRSRRYGGASQTAGLDAIAEFCTDLPLKAFFTWTGQIAVGLDDHRTTTLWYDAPRWVRWDRHDLGAEGSLRIGYDDSSICNRVSGQFVRDSVRDAYAQTLEVRDLSVTSEDAAADLPMPWAHASLA